MTSHKHDATGEVLAHFELRVDQLGLLNVFWPVGDLVFPHSDSHVLVFPACLWLPGGNLIGQ